MTTFMISEIPNEQLQMRFTRRKDIYKYISRHIWHLTSGKKREKKYIWRAGDDLPKYVVTLPSRIGIAPTFYITSIPIIIIICITRA